MPLHAPLASDSSARPNPTDQPACWGLPYRCERVPWTLLDPVLMVIPLWLLGGSRVNAAYHLRLVAFALAGSPLDLVPASPARLCAEEDGDVCSAVTTQQSCRPRFRSLAPRKRTRVLGHQQSANAHSPAVARTLTTPGQWASAATSCSNPRHPGLIDQTPVSLFAPS